MEASGTSTGQGAPTPGTTQAGAPAAGQGQQQGQSTAEQGFNWGLFPDVPETQRELLEPHLRNIQGHVTKLEQQYAPYKGLMEAVPGEQADSLVAFLNGYSQDPLSTVFGILQELQESEVIPKTLAMQELQAILKGERDLGAPAAPGQEQAQPGQEEIPPWAQQMMQRFEQMDQQEQTRMQQEAESQQNQLFEQAKTNIRSQLAQSGITDDLVSDEMITAAIIAADGDEARVVPLITEMRDKFVGSFTNNRTNGASQAPRVQGQLPKTPKGRIGRKGDSFTEANVGARQFLEQQAAMGGS